MEFGKMIKTKKLRLFNTFPTAYHLLNSDKRFETNCQITVRPKLKFRKQYHVFSNLLLIRDEYRKMSRDRKVAHFP